MASMHKSSEKRWRNILPLAVVIFVFILETYPHTHWATGTQWIYFSFLITLILIALLMPQTNKEANNNAFNSMLLMLDAGVGFLLLAAAILVIAGYADISIPLFRTLEKCTPLLIAWWVVVYKRQPQRIAVYMLLFFIGLLGCSPSLQEHGALEFVAFGIVEAATVRFALSSLQAQTTNLDILEQGSDKTLDPITGFLLPAIFEAELALVAAMSDRQRSPFTLLAWEIVGFHAYVGQFGFITGEKLMRLTALSIGDCLRISDTVGRWEKERFLVILPDTTVNEAKYVMDKMQQRVALIEAVDKGPVALRFALAEHHHGDDPLVVVEKVELALADTTADLGQQAQANMIA